MRGNTHVIETESRRVVDNLLPASEFVRRDLGERDYGIDYSIEVFRDGFATGDYFLVQAKGTEAEFTDSVERYSFPVETIQYARLFNIPFFVFYVSTTSKEVRYIWLQKYTELVLVDHDNWENQKTVTLSFPKENNLEKNIFKLKELLLDHRSNSESLRFLRTYEELLFHSENVLISDQYAVASACKELCLDLEKMRETISYFAGPLVGHGHDIDIMELKYVFERIAEEGQVSSEGWKFVTTQIGLLEEVKESILRHTFHEKVLHDTWGQNTY